MKDIVEGFDNVPVRVVLCCTLKKWKVFKSRNPVFEISVENDVSNVMLNGFLAAIWFTGVVCNTSATRRTILSPLFLPSFRSSGWSTPQNTITESGIMVPACYLSFVKAGE